MTAMNDRIQKKDLVRRLAQRMQTDEQTAALWLEGFVDILYQAFQEGQSVTLPGLGSFYVRSRQDTWVFKFNPAQRLRALLGWSSTYKGEL
jgi:hypothetical protein